MTTKNPKKKKKKKETRNHGDTSKNGSVLAIFKWGYKYETFGLSHGGCTDMALVSFGAHFFFH